MARRTYMPIRDTEITVMPMAVLVPHEAQALFNHGQILDRLAERGGITICEALAILEDRPWSKQPDAAAARSRFRELT